MAYTENSKNQNPGRQSGEMEKTVGRESNFAEIILCFDRAWNGILVKKTRLSGVSEFHSRRPLTEKAPLPSDDRTYGMERTSESEDLVETECDRNERLVKIMLCRLFICIFIRKVAISKPLTSGTVTTAIFGTKCISLR